MKKLLCLLLSLIMLLCCSFTTVSANEDVILLTEMIDLGKADTDIGVSHIVNNKWQEYISNYIYSDEDVKNILSHFLYITSINDEMDINTDEFPSDDYFQLYLVAEDGVTNCEIFFDSDKILVSVMKPKGSISGPWITQKGWFKFNNSFAYRSLVLLLDSFKEKGEANKQQPTEESHKNEIAINNINILYTGTFSFPDLDNGFEWGVFSYAEEGKSDTKTAAFMTQIGYGWETNKKKVAIISHEIDKDNKIVFNTDRVLNFTVGNDTGSIYDQNFELTGYFSIQVTVSDNSKPESVVASFTPTYNTSPPYIEDSYQVDMNTYFNEMGVLPAPPFLIADKISEKDEEKNITPEKDITADTEKTDEEKPVITEKDEENNPSTTGIDKASLNKEYNEKIRENPEYTDLTFYASDIKVNEKTGEVTFKNSNKFDGDYDDREYVIDKNTVHYEEILDFAEEDRHFDEFCKGEYTFITFYVSKKDYAELDRVPVISVYAIAEKAVYYGANENSHMLKAIEYMKERDIMVGYPNGSFMEKGSMSRAEFAKVIYKFSNPENSDVPESDTPFSDVPKEHWAASYINACTKSGAIKGFEDGTFRPEEKITAEQAIKILVCELGFGEDAEKIGGYPKGYVALAKEKGILEETENAFEYPMAVLMRGDAAIMFYNASKYLGN